MRGVIFDDDEDLKKWLTNYFESGTADFWCSGIDKLVDRWEQVVNNDGEYD